MQNIEFMLEELFKQNKGYLHAKDIQQKRMLQYELQALHASGRVTRLRRGLYRHEDLATLDHWQEVSIMYPKAVLCMYSAASFYELTTYMPPAVHLAIGNKAKMKTEKFPPVQLYYWPDKYYMQHIVIINDVKIYSIERTVCDLIRLESQSGFDVVKEVCQNYLRRQDKNINLLMTTAREIDVYDKVTKLFEILI